MKVVLFSIICSSSILLATQFKTGQAVSLAMTKANDVGIQQQSELFLVQTQTEIPPDPLELAKESLKDLQSMVEQGEAKAMGFNCFEVYKKFRKALTHPGKNADQVYARVKTLMKTMEEDEKAKQDKD